VLAALVLAFAALAYFFFVRSVKASINSVAIMPFVNVSKEPNTEYLQTAHQRKLITKHVAVSSQLKSSPQVDLPVQRTGKEH
jgi:hypothetical protein